MLNTERVRNPEMKRWFEEHFNHTARMVYLGAPLLADDDKIVTIANMKVGAYTIAAQPDIARNISVTHATVAAGTDTLGTLAVVGKDIDGYTISETITPVADSTVYSTNMYKTITSITGAGWVINGGNDTIIIGIGPKLGMPFKLTSAGEVLLGILGVAPVEPVVVAGGTKETSSIDISAATYDGTKKAFVFVVE